MFLEVSVSGYAESKIMNNRGQSYIVFESHNFILESIALCLLSQVKYSYRMNAVVKMCVSPFVQKKRYVCTNMLTWNGFISGRKQYQIVSLENVRSLVFIITEKVLKVFQFIFFLSVT